MCAVFGFDVALGDLPPVLFTTLAPSAVVAIALMMMFVAGRVGKSDMRKRLNTCLWIPLLVAAVSLAAFALHMGSPSNTLRAFLEDNRGLLLVGVVCAVAFLALTGLYWLYSFAKRPHPGLQRVWALFIVLASVAFMMVVSFAYRADAIVAGDSLCAPVSLWLNGLIGGPLLALVAIRAAKYEVEGHSVGRMLLGVAVVALVANVALYAAQGFAAANAGEATAVAPCVAQYFAFVGAFAAFAFAGIAVDAHAVARRPELKVARATFACLLVFVGIFAMRIAFHLVHLASGVGM